MTAKEDEHHRSAEALEALAAGGGSPEAHTADDQASQGGAPAEHALASLAASRDAVTACDAEHCPQGGVSAGVEALSGLVPPTGASRAARQQNTAYVHSIRFKKTMVPPLMVVGAMLLVLSMITLAMLLWGAGSRGDSLHRYGAYAILAACPLAALLLCGAWWFHREVAQLGRRDPENPPRV